MVADKFNRILTVCVEPDYEGFENLKELGCRLVHNRFRTFYKSLVCLEGQNEFLE